MKLIENHIVKWLSDYLESSSMKGFVVGVSGGVDSAVTSTLCAKTGYPTYVLNMPIFQKASQYDRSIEHINWLKANYDNTFSENIDLSPVLNSYVDVLNSGLQDHLSMANLRSRIRMSTLYVYASNKKLLVAGTGNKVEDFGVGFYTKYGDGGVDISPIADLMKSEVFELSKYLGVIKSIQNAAPTDGLWDDDRNDEDQLGATYNELEWAMKYIDENNTKELTKRESEVIDIYKNLNNANKHKMNPIPVCYIPKNLK